MNTLQDLDRSGVIKARTMHEFHLLWFMYAKVLPNHRRNSDRLAGVMPGCPCKYFPVVFASYLSGICTNVYLIMLFLFLSLNNFFFSYIARYLKYMVVVA